MERASKLSLSADDVHRLGVDALHRLYAVALRDSGQCRHVARFLLGLYNGDRFPFDLTDLRCIDGALFDDCMRVLQMDARICRREVHAYFERGGELWEELADRWCVAEIARLKIIARSVIERELADFPDGVAGLIMSLKQALRYRECREDQQANSDGWTTGW